MKDLDALILAVPHESYKSLTPKDLQQFFVPKGKLNGHSSCLCSPLVLDLKGFWPVDQMQQAGIKLWRL